MKIQADQNLGKNTWKIFYLSEFWLFLFFFNDLIYFFDSMKVKTSDKLVNSPNRV